MEGVRAETEPLGEMVEQDAKAGCYGGGEGAGGDRWNGGVPASRLFTVVAQAPAEASVF